jgi:hypothetical protein
MQRGARQKHSSLATTIKNKKNKQVADVNQQKNDDVTHTHKV